MVCFDEDRLCVLLIDFISVIDKERTRQGKNGRSYEKKDSTYRDQADLSEVRFVEFSIFTKKKAIGFTCKQRHCSHSIDQFHLQFFKLLTQYQLKHG
jgi:hypothetical protein